MDEQNFSQKKSKIPWNDIADEFIRENNGKLSYQEMQDWLTAYLGVVVSKNNVSVRITKLGLQYKGKKRGGSEWVL